MGKRDAPSLLYSDLARYYDLIYSWKDYSSEVRFLKRLIASGKKSDGNELLDVGCGTGRHIALLADSFRCTGLDLSNEMLRVARMNVKGATFVNGNMFSFRLRKKFDVILCLFSAIAYAKTDGQLRGTLSSFSGHLKDGGIVIIQPWIQKSDWKKGHISLETFDSEAVKIARASYSGGTSKVSKFRMEYLIAEKGKGLRHLVEEDSFPYFDRTKYERMMRDLGLRPRYVASKPFGDRGLLTGTKIPRMLDSEPVNAIS